MLQHFDLSTARQPGRKVQRVNVDFPMPLLKMIDLEANRIGVTRQAFIKLRIADSLPKVVDRDRDDGVAHTDDTTQDR